MLLDKENETVNISPRGMVSLATELSDLKKIRLEILERLLDALSDNVELDNSDYKSARDELAIVNGRIRELEYILRHAEWILPGNGEDALKRKV